MITFRKLTVACAVSWLLGPALASAQVASCPALPAYDCNRGDAGLLQLQDSNPTAPFVWTLNQGEANDLADFGDPKTTTGYAVCGYAGTHSDLVFEASIPADATSWAPLTAPASGWQYSNTLTPSDGIHQIDLVAGAEGQASIGVMGGGAGLPALPHNPDYPVRFQLINNETGVCWEDSFDGVDILVDTATELHLASGPEDPNAPLAVYRQRVPIPKLSAADLGVTSYTGAQAAADPIAPLLIPDHPFLNNEGDSRIHNDHYSSGVYNRAGPLGKTILGLGTTLAITSSDLKLAPDDLAYICAMSAFTEDGYPISTCFTFGAAGGSARLNMFHPTTLDVLAEVETAPRGFVQGPGGGAYFSILHDGRILVGPPTNAVEVWAVEVNGGTANFVRYESFDVSGQVVGGGLLPDTVVDFEGRLWWVASSGEIGYVDPDTGQVYASTTGESLQNSLSVDETGVYVVTYESLQKFSVDEPTGEVVQVWRTPYDNTGPGIIQPGSGTTPTLFGLADDLVGIADTAIPRVNAMVYDRTDGAVVCQVPLFRDDESGAENSFIGYGDDFVVVNNGGFTGPFNPQRTIYPGMERHKVQASRTGCDPVWINQDNIANSAQLSTTNGIIYGYATDPDVADNDVHYLTATDWDTGQELFRSYVGNDGPYNAITGQFHIGPDGSAYVGTVSGITRVADAPPGC